MSLFNPPIQKFASANIRAGRLLALGTAEGQVAEATGITAPFIGISANRFKFPSGSFEQQAFPFLCLAGEAVDYRGDGDEADAVAGATISNLQLPLTSDSAGRAVTASVATVGAGYFVGYPLNTCIVNEIVRVRVQTGLTNIGAS